MKEMGEAEGLEGTESTAGAGTTDPRPRPVDWLVALGLTGVSWLAIFVAHDLDDDLATALPRWVEYALAGAMFAPLPWRRRAPLVVLLAVTVASCLVWGFRVPDSLGPTAAFFLALHAAGAHSRHPRRNLARGLAVGALLLVVAWQILSQQEFVGFDAALFAAYSVAVNVGYAAVGWLLGDASRRRAEDAAELARRADQLAANQREREARAVHDERVRIARELHDVVAHHVSVMGLHAGAARRLVRDDPERAAGVLGGIEQSGREAIGELARVVGVLRGAGDARDVDACSTAPQPTLADLQRLVDGCGLPARLQRIGAEREVPPAVALSAYRVAQEALTNVLKHAGPVPTTVVLTFGAPSLQIEIVNAAPGPRTGAPGWTPDTGSGRGIVGMRERVTMLGGDFTHGGVATGGYRVAAVFPVPAGRVDGNPVETTPATAPDRSRRPGAPGSAVPTQRGGER